MFEYSITTNIKEMMKARLLLLFRPDMNMPTKVERINPSNIMSQFFFSKNRKNPISPYVIMSPHDSCD